MYLQFLISGSEFGCAFVVTIRARRWKMIGHTLRHPEELHTIILEGVIEGKITAGRPQNSYIGQIKCDVRVNTYTEQELKEMACNSSDWRIGVINLRVEKKPLLGSLRLTI